MADSYTSLIHVFSSVPLKLVHIPHLCCKSKASLVLPAAIFISHVQSLFSISVYFIAKHPWNWISQLLWSLIKLPPWKLFWALFLLTLLLGLLFNLSSQTTLFIQSSHHGTFKDFPLTVAGFYIISTKTFSHSFMYNLCLALCTSLPPLILFIVSAIIFLKYLHSRFLPQMLY